MFKEIRNRTPLSLPHHQQRKDYRSEHRQQMAWKLLLKSNFGRAPSEIVSIKQNEGFPKINALDSSGEMGKCPEKASYRSSHRPEQWPSNKNHSDAPKRSMIVCKHLARRRRPSHRRHQHLHSSASRGWQDRIFRRFAIFRSNSVVPMNVFLFGTYVASLSVWMFPDDGSPGSFHRVGRYEDLRIKERRN